MVSTIQPTTSRPWANAFAHPATEFGQTPLRGSPVPSLRVCGGLSIAMVLLDLIAGDSESDIGVMEMGQF